MSKEREILPNYLPRPAGAPSDGNWSPVHVHVTPDGSHYTIYTGSRDLVRHWQHNAALIRQEAAYAAHAATNGPSGVVSAAALGVGAAGHLQFGGGAWAHIFEAPNPSTFGGGAFGPGPSGARFRADETGGNPLRKPQPGLQPPPVRPYRPNTSPRGPLPVAANTNRYLRKAQNLLNLSRPWFGRSPYHKTLSLLLSVYRAYSGNPSGIGYYNLEKYGWYLKGSCQGPFTNAFVAFPANYPATNCLGGQALTTYPITPIDQTPPAYGHSAGAGYDFVQSWMSTVFFGETYEVGFPGSQVWRFDHHAHWERIADTSQGEALEGFGGSWVPAPRPYRAKVSPTYVEPYPIHPMVRSLAPELVPPNRAAPEPAGLPYRHRPGRRLNPNRDPLEQPHFLPTPRPIPAPGARPVPRPRPGDRPADQLVTDIQTGPNPGPRPGVGPPIHRAQPPGRGTKERKGQADPAWANVIKRAAGAVTESSDVLSAAYDSLPPEAKPGYKLVRRKDGTREWKKVYDVGAAKKAAAVFRHADKISVDEFVKGLVSNAATDMVVGTQAAAASKYDARSRKARRYKRPFGPTVGPGI